LILFASESLLAVILAHLRASETISSVKMSVYWVHADQTCNQTFLQGPAYCFKWLGKA